MRWMPDAACMPDMKWGEVPEDVLKMGFLLLCCHWAALPELSVLTFTVDKVSLK